MSGAQTVQSRPHSIDWTYKLSEKTCTIKNLSQSGLSFVWFIQGIPKIIKMLPSSCAVLLDGFKWIPYIKPTEVFFGAIKDVGSFFEFPEKLFHARFIGKDSDRLLPWTKRVEKAWHDNAWKVCSRFASLGQVSIEALFLIPGKWFIPAMGAWAAQIGLLFPVTALKDGLTATAALFNAKACTIDRDRAITVIEKCKKRIDPNGPLLKLRTLLEKAQHTSLSPNELLEIDRLKADHRTKKAEEKEKVYKQINTQIQALEKKITGLEAEQPKIESKDHKRQAFVVQEIKNLNVEIDAKREKQARMAYWHEQAQTVNLDKLREVVVYKIDKNEVRIANSQMRKEKAIASRWFDLSKATVIGFSYLLALGVAAIVAPYFAAIGFTAAGLTSFFFLGQWITGFTTGLFGIGKTVSAIRYEKEFEIPQTHLYRF